MNEEQGDRIIDILTDIKDQLESINSRMESLEFKIDNLDINDINTPLEKLTEFVESLSSDGLFSDLLGERIGEKFNGEISNSLEDISSNLDYKNVETLHCNVLRYNLVKAYFFCRSQ